MKNIYPLFISIILITSITDIYAQQLPVFNQYLFNPFVYNPARAGSEEFGSLFIGQRKQWADIPNAPDTRIVTFEMPLPFEEKTGLGITFFQDQTHIIERLGGSFTYAYHIPIADDQKVSFGVAGGFLNQRINFDDATIADQNDPALISQSASSTTFDVGFGMHYRFKNLGIDISVPQLSNSNIRFLSNNGRTSTFELVSHYLGAVRYRIPLKRNFLEDENNSPELSLEPVLLIRGARNTPVQYDVNMLFSWYNQFILGAGYRSGGQEFFTSSANVSAGFRISNLIFASYNFEFLTRNDDRVSLGNTHEFSLGFKFGKTRKRVKELEQKILNMENNQIGLNDSITDLSEASVTDLNTPSEQTESSALEETEISQEDLELLEQLDQLDKLRKLQELQKLQEMQQLLELQDMMKRQALLDINKSTIPENQKNELRSGLENNFEKLTFEKVGSVFFQKNSSDLSDVAKAELRNIQQMIRRKENLVTIYIAGNASIEGESVYNLVLSNRRAVAVKNYLYSNGMDDSIVLPIPYGAENPITKEQIVEADREKNRRVDIFILGK